MPFVMPTLTLACTSRNISAILFRQAYRCPPYLVPAALLKESVKFILVCSCFGRSVDKGTVEAGWTWFNKRSVRFSCGMLTDGEPDQGCLNLEFTRVNTKTMTET